MSACRAPYSALLIVLCVSLATCSSRPAESNSVVFLIETMPANLDPRIGTDAQSQRLHSLIFSGLLQRDAQMNPQPDLAERWETPDPLTYIFRLRRGVRFHDGRSLTSADVKFTFDSILRGEIKTPKRGAFRMVAGIDAPDDFTVVFHLKEPFASFLWNLVRPAVGIVPADAPADFAQHPVGTGPFRFVSARQDDEVILDRNPDYFAAPARIDRVRFRIVPDATVRALELRKGAADIALNSLSPDTVPALAKMSGLDVTQQPGTNLVYLAFNFDDPILARREVRQALAYATDRAQLVKYLMRNQARPAGTLLPPNHWAFAEDIHHYDYDPPRAEQLLDAAGFPRKRGPASNNMRLQLTLKTSTDELSRLLGAALQDQWRRVGVDLQVRSLEFATLSSDIVRGAFQVFTLRWIGANNDPDILEFVFHSQKIPPNGANRGRYRNPQLDTLLDLARVEMDREKRRALLRDAQKIIADDLPYLTLWYLDNVCVHRSRVSSVQLTPAGDYDFLTGIVLH